MTTIEDLDRLEAREAVVEALKREGLLLKVEDYTHNVGYSERSNVPIEPYLSEQWFLKYPQVPRSTAAVEKGEIKFLPRALGEDLCALDAQSPRLVHLPPTLVGPPDTGVV